MSVMETYPSLVSASSRRLLSPLADVRLAKVILWGLLTDDDDAAAAADAAEAHAMSFRKRADVMVLHFLYFE